MAIVVRMVNRTNLWHTTPASCIYNAGLHRQSSPRWGQSAHQRCAAQPQAWSTRNQSRYRAHFVPPTDRHTPVPPEPAVCSTHGTPVSQRTTNRSFFSCAHVASDACTCSHERGCNSKWCSIVLLLYLFGWQLDLAMSPRCSFSRRGARIPFYIGLLNHCGSHLSERLNISRVRLFAIDCTNASNKFANGCLHLWSLLRAFAIIILPTFFALPWPSRVLALLICHVED